MIQLTTHVQVILSDTDGIISIHRKPVYAEQELARLAKERRAAGWRVMPTENKRHVRLEKGDKIEFISIQKHELK